MADTVEQSSGGTEILSSRPLSKPSPKPILNVLAGQPCSPPPLWLMRQAGRYLPEYREVRGRAKDFLDLCYRPDLAAEVTLQPVRRFGFDAAILFADILLIPDALGQPLEFREGEGPVLDPVTDGKAVARLDPRRLHERLGPVYETVARVREALPVETTLIGFCGAPWTVSTYMVGGRGGGDQQPARIMAYRDPDAFAGLIDLLVETSAAYLLRQIAAGAEAVQIFDTWAGALSESGFERWVVQPTAKIVSRVRATAPGIPIIGFPKGAGAGLARYAAATGVDAVGLDTATRLSNLADGLGMDLPVQGNLDPMALVAGGRALEDEVRRIRNALSERPHIFNLGHGIVPETPIAHVERLIELVREAA